MVGHDWSIVSEICEKNVDKSDKGHAVCNKILKSQVRIPKCWQIRFYEDTGRQMRLLTINDWTWMSDNRKRFNHERETTDPRCHEIWFHKTTVLFLKNSPSTIHIWLYFKRSQSSGTHHTFKTLNFKMSKTACMINRYQLFLTGANVLYNVTNGDDFVQLGLIMSFFLNFFHLYCFDEVNNKQFGFLSFILSVAIAVRPFFHYSCVGPF